MTLSDLATLVCTKINQNEDEDLAACKLFLQRRYEMIWQDQLWKDSLIDWTYTLPDAGAAYAPDSIWLPTKQRLILPVQFDRVIAVRTDTRSLNVQTPEIFYRTNFDSFQNQGTMLDFLCLPPCVWEFDFANIISLHYAGLSAAVNITADILEADGATVTRSTASLSAGGSEHNNNYTVDTGSRIDSFSKQASSQQILIGAGPTLLNSCATTGSHTFTFYDASSTLLQTSTVAYGDEVMYPYLATQFKIDGGVSVAITGATTFAGVITITDIGIFQTAAYADRAVTAVTLKTTDLVAPRRQRIQIVGAIDTPAPTIRVLGKSKPNTFTDDNDSTALTGVDNCLLAVAEYDMLKRERQYAKAQSVMQEFQLLLGQLKQQEVVQMANNKRIIPEDGYGNPYDMYSHPPLSF